MGGLNHPFVAGIVHEINFTNPSFGDLPFMETPIFASFFGSTQLLNLFHNQLQDNYCRRLRCHDSSLQIVSLNDTKDAMKVFAEYRTDPHLNACRNSFFVCGILTSNLWCLCTIQHSQHRSWILILPSFGVPWCLVFAFYIWLRGPGSARMAQFSGLDFSNDSKWGIKNWNFLPADSDPLPCKELVPQQPLGLTDSSKTLDDARNWSPKCPHLGPRGQVFWEVPGVPSSNTMVTSCCQ